MKHAFLGSAFFGNDVGSLVVKYSLYSAASAGLDRHQALSLKDVFSVPVYDSFLKKATSRVLKLKLTEPGFSLILVVIFTYLFFSTQLG